MAYERFVSAHGHEGDDRSAAVSGTASGGPMVGQCWIDLYLSCVGSASLQKGNQCYRHKHMAPKALIGSMVA